MKNKLFTIIKTGYSSGIYGCTNEYFTLIAISGHKTTSYYFKGLYGEEYRVGEIAKGLGYTEFYSGGAYGKIPSREYPANYFSNHDEIEQGLKSL